MGEGSNATLALLWRRHLSRITGGHLPQIAVCTVLPVRDYSYRRLEVKAVDDSTFEALALSIGGVTANQIRLAFDEVFTPGAPEPVKTQG